MPREITAGQIKTARIIAVALDIIQLMLSPISPFFIDDVLDVVGALIFIRLLGFHWVFLPSFLMEISPVVEFAPTWTLAVLIATRNGPTNPDGSARAVTPVLTGKITDVEVNK